ncbi:MAG: hypothetical protein R2844_23270 [Caldilineales bacterium]
MYAALNDVQMLSATDGWIVGDNGKIRVGISALSGTPVSSPTTDNRRRSTCWLVMAKLGRGLRRDHLYWDGDTWSQVSSPIGQPLWSVSMVSAGDGWAVRIEC